MAVFNRVESPRKIEDVIYNKVVLAGDGWNVRTEPGQVLQSRCREETKPRRHCSNDTIIARITIVLTTTIASQGNVYLTSGSVLGLNQVMNF